MHAVTAFYKNLFERDVKKMTFIFFLEYILHLISRRINKPMKKLFALTTLVLFTTVLFAQNTDAKEEKQPEPTEVPVEKKDEPVAEEKMPEATDKPVEAEDAPETSGEDQASDDATKEESAGALTTSLPSIKIRNIDGEEVDIASYGTNGKITIISFWATWCKPCIKELKNINDLLADWEEDYNAELVAISVDDSRNIAKVKPYASGLGWDFDVLLDPNGEVQRALNVANPPVTFLIDAKGKIVYTHTSYVEGDEYELEEHIEETFNKQ
jgi:peroxiredoxin